MMQEAVGRVNVPTMHTAACCAKATPQPLPILFMGSYTLGPTMDHYLLILHKCILLTKAPCYCIFGGSYENLYRLV